MIKEISLVLVRILALYVFIKGLGHLINIIQIMYPYFLEDYSGTFNVGFIVFLSSLTGILFILIGILLWFQTRRIVLLIIDNKEMSAGDFDYKYKELYTLGFILVGIVLFAETLPDLINQIGQIILYSIGNYPDELDNNRIKTLIAVVGDSLKIIISIMLVLKAHGIYGIIKKLRELGMKDNNTQD